MKKLPVKQGLLTATTAASLILAASVSFAAHTTTGPIQLYTFEELAVQMNGGAKVPVTVQNGMPYSPKQTCGSEANGQLGSCHSYDKISDHAFHSNQGRTEYVDSSNGAFNGTKNKPWTQSTAMVGKW